MHPWTKAYNDLYSEDDLVELFAIKNGLDHIYTSYRVISNHFEDGDNIFYYKTGTNILHREDGPAIEYYNGDKEWRIDGLLDREDGPAIENDNSVFYNAWYKRGFIPLSQEYPVPLGRG